MGKMVKKNKETIERLLRFALKGDKLDEGDEEYVKLARYRKKGFKKGLLIVKK